MKKNPRVEAIKDEPNIESKKNQLVKIAASFSLALAFFFGCCYLNLSSVGSGAVALLGSILFGLTSLIVVKRLNDGLIKKLLRTSATLLFGGLGIIMILRFLQ